MTRTESAERVIAAVKEQTDTAILFYSTGKDSIVTLDLIYPHFKRIVCVFMYFVKGLEHVDRYIRWAKVKYPNAEFVQVPHWNLTYLLRSGLYCTANPKVKLMQLRDVADSVMAKTGIEACFFGMKKADSMNRRLMLNGYADENYFHKGFAYPIAEWTQKDVLAYMKQKGLPAPVRYSLAASSGVGFNLDCFKYMEKYFPQDLQKIYKVFPLSDRILWEEHQRLKQTASE